MTDARATTGEHDLALIGGSKRRSLTYRTAGCEQSEEADEIADGFCI
ncbi:MAG: hypothetical protein JRH12_08335 [Deltaproteobacteria bacterium]|nr:hypothetical protein [Deltaproteobacteria bacterium]MBW2482790.1 hypothetical protein [Deltaproteobacteria bacterium]